MRCSRGIRIREPRRIRKRAGGTNDLQNVDATLQGTQLTVTFDRLLKTGDPNDLNFDGDFTTSFARGGFFNQLPGVHTLRGIGPSVQLAATGGGNAASAVTASAYVAASAAAIALV